jgi:predicted  nucleic acid-binding Zn-ribbon protein
MVLKNIIAPVQAWLLSKGQCVGCGMPLQKGKKEKRKDGTEKITCKCGRIFIYNSKNSKYRRALFEEV